MGSYDYGGYYGATFDNAKSGLVSVWAADVGVGLSYGQIGVAFTNEGVIKVVAGQAVGVYGPWSFSNSGSIIATDIKADGGSIGVKMGYASVYHGPSETLTNSGLIQADKAFYFDAYELSPPWAQTIVLNNSGQIVGAIDLSLNAGADTISNTGSLTGAIEAAASSNAAVTNSGTIILSGASQVTTLSNTGTIAGGGTLVVSGTGAALDNQVHGLIEATSNLTVSTPNGQMTNDGIVEANGGTLTIEAAVGGSGSAVIAGGGTLLLGAAFSQDVDFTGVGGLLALADSQAYGGVVTGFSAIGATKLDLVDINYGGATTATFSGTAAGGTLTVTDGIHTAEIALAGDYLDKTFVVESDGDGGVLVADWTIPYDFIHTDRSEFLIENTSGAVALGEVTGGHAGYAWIGALGPEWTFEGVGDFLGGGAADILIENTAGAVAIGEMVGQQLTYTAVTSLGPEWTFKGVGDFLGDGKADFLIENASGAVVVGEVFGGQPVFTQIGTLAAPWSFHGVGDFLGDGKSDFLIESSAGVVEVAEVLGGKATYTTVATLGLEWAFKGVGDFLGDGKADFLIENTAGVVEVGEVSPSHHVVLTPIAALGPEWTFVGVGDYLGEGHAQVLIENAAGAVVVGDYTGGTIHYTQVAGLGSEWSFH